MKALPIVAAVLGIGIMLALVGYFGAGAVIQLIVLLLFYYAVVVSRFSPDARAQTP